MARIHVQNLPDDPDFAISPATWRAQGGPEDVSFGTSEAEFVSGVAGAEILVVQQPALRGFKHLVPPSLRAIFCCSAGLDSLAPYDWLPRQTMLLNNSGVHGKRGGECVALALLMLSSQMPALIAAQAAQRWEKRYTPSIAGRHLVVIGAGALGAAGARAARGLGMRTTGVRTSATPHADFDRIVATADIDTVLGEADFLLLATPLTAQTAKILDARRIGLLPAHCGVINIGRGALIEQDALCDALDAGRLGGAFLDVTSPEPLPAGHRLWRTANTIITPHVLIDDPQSYAADSVTLFLANLAALERGETPPNLFDTTRGY